MKTLKNHEALAVGSRGRFARNIYEAYCTADSRNRERLEKTFPDILEIITEPEYFAAGCHEDAPDGYYWVFWGVPTIVKNSKGCFYREEGSDINVSDYTIWGPIPLPAPPI